MADSLDTPIRRKIYLSLVSRFPDDVPVTVLHALRFRSTAIYPPSSPYASLEPISGRDAFYQRYIPVSNAAAKEVGLTPGETRFYLTFSIALLFQNDIPWDVVTARSFESFASYTRYQASKAYTEKAVPHRDAALRDWSLIARGKEEPPKM